EDGLLVAPPLVLALAEHRLAPPVLLRVDLAAGVPLGQRHLGRAGAGPAGGRGGRPPPDQVGRDSQQAAPEQDHRRAPDPPAGAPATPAGVSVPPAWVSVPRDHASHILSVCRFAAVEAGLTRAGRPAAGGWLSRARRAGTAPGGRAMGGW